MKNQPKGLKPLVSAMPEQTAPKSAYKITYSISIIL